MRADPKFECFVDDGSPPQVERCRENLGSDARGNGCDDRRCRVGGVTTNVDLICTRSEIDLAAAPAYSSGIIDCATATLTLARGANPHVLEDDATCFGSESISGGTCYLELRVDEIAETSRWVTARTGD